MMWESDEDGSLVLHTLVAHDTAMLAGDRCGLRLSLAPYGGRHKTISPSVHIDLSPEQAQALIRDLQHIVDWTRLSPEERKARAVTPRDKIP